MKKTFSILGVATLLGFASLSSAKAATTITAWTFDNLSIGANSSPSSSTGFGTASAYNLTSPDVQSLAGSSSGGVNSWEVTGGWSTTQPIGTQGAQFAASTAGFYQVQVSFDVYATTNAEADLQVQYSTDGKYWQNATITSAGNSGVLANNTITTNSLVVGSYLILTNNGTAAWNNQVTVNLTGVSGADNDPAFVIRIVNASTGTNCLDTTGAIYNNAGGGDWTLDNVVVSGTSFDTVAEWTFDNDYVAPPGKLLDTNNTPAAAISNNTATAACIGFGTPANPLLSSTFATGSSTNSADITANGAPYSSTGSAGQDVWRLRGQPGNGWLSTQPIGSQGAEFDVSTINYSNILVTFDLYFTSQGEAKMCVLYTTDNWATTNVANNFACSSFPTLIQTNAAYPIGSSNTVTGTYFFNSVGSQFYNYMSVDFAGIPNVANNPQFGFRVVNAAKLGDCVNALGQAYNNNSGNGRIDNVAVNGQFTGTFAPTLTNQPSATVDAPFTNTFSDTTGWHTNISAIYVNGTFLPNSAYTVTSSNIVYNPTPPSTNPFVLDTAGYDYIVVYATNYTSAKVTQYVGTGLATKLAYVQLAGPSASGGTLTANPSFTVTDQYGNGTTNPYSSMVVTATVSNSPATWTLGGSTVQPIINGSCTFTDLTATLIGTSAITNAAVHFAISGYTPLTATNSTSFTIGVAPTHFTLGNLAAIQIDTTGNNTTFSMIELMPSAAGQTTPVNINPITATGTNGLRLSGSGSCGHLSLSDDKTFLVFAAFDDASSATPDETFNLNRAVGTMNYTNNFTKTGWYVSNSYGGSQARSACSPDSVDFLIDDKGGLYVYDTVSPQSPTPNVYEQNNYCTRSFGGAAWVLTQKVVANLPSPAVFQFNNDNVGQLDYYESGNDSPVPTGSATPPPDGNVVDFYMLSTNGTSDPTSFGILYTIDQNSGTNGSSGVITKWSTADQITWTFNGAWTNTDNGASLFATTNGVGGVYLYYANGSGGSAKNNLVRVTDQSIMGSINIISTNTIYTAPSGTSIEGVTFVPEQTANAAELTPPPILTAQANYSTNKFLPFVITLTPDDGFWRTNITGITVNGTALPASAYATNVAGKITFYPSNSVALESPGQISIAISATGYSTNLITQPIGGLPTQLVISTQPTAPAADGAVLAKQPVVFQEDANGLTITNPTYTVTATVGAGVWTLGGTTTASESVSKGTATFAGLTAFSTTAVTGATITFTAPGLVSVTSSAFNIAAPIPVNLGGATLTGGKLKFTFTNPTGLSFSVRATNNITAPMPWPVVGPAVESPAGSGNYQFTNSLPATNAALFYMLSQP